MMTIYQFNPDRLPDACFYAGDLKYIVPGNECRLLDHRRTPLRVLDVKRASGLFVVEILDFEDKGWRWEMPFESVSRCQFAQGSIEASEADVADYAETISRLDQPLEIPADPVRRKTSEARVVSLREGVRAWLDRESVFLKSAAKLNVAAMMGEPALWADLAEIEASCRQPSASTWR